MFNDDLYYLFTHKSSLNSFVEVKTLKCGSILDINLLVSTSTLVNKVLRYCKL